MIGFLSVVSPHRARWKQLGFRAQSFRVRG
jgi:hypothetical protein